MKIPQNPFNDALQTCLNNIEEFKKRVEKESELKNSLLSQMANFYTDNFQNTYFKEEKTKRIGQIEYIFSKNGVFFAHVYFLDITTNSKIRKVYSNIELFSSEMEEMTAISEDEYYIIHLESGMMVNWYKHLGRTNTCSQKDRTIDDYYEFFRLFKEELDYFERRMQ